MNLTLDLLEKELDIKWRAAARAHFYPSLQEVLKSLIDIPHINRIPTLDVELYLPYRRSREAAEWLEITAISVNRDFYAKNFRIKKIKGREV